VNADPCQPVAVTSADGALITACLHGGHVLGWQPAGSAERLWLSPTTRCGPGRALRGGVPVIFPQFSDRGPLPKHGFARDRAWEPVEPPAAGGAAAWSARLRDDEATRAIWPHPFALTLTAVATGPELTLELAAENTGTDPFEFTAALHAYLALGEATAVVTGLDGLPFEENAAPGRLQPLEAEALPATARRDIAVRGVGGPVALDDPVLGTLSLTAEGFEDRVVWNPGPGHGLPDVPEGAERGFVCVEPAVLTSVRLPGSERWTARVRLRVGTEGL
jgi:glucose-6-phosphate 1-epimerase